MKALERKIDWLIGFVLILCTLFCLTSLCLVYAGLSFTSRAKSEAHTKGREEAIRMVREEMYAPLIQELRALLPEDNHGVP